MNPALLSKSPTVATLNARGELHRLRMLADPAKWPSNPAGTDWRLSDIRAELDRLEDLLSEHFCTDEVPGFLDQKTVDECYVHLDSYKEMRQDCETAEADRDKAEARIKELEDSLDESEDESKKRLAGALAECARLRAVAEKMTAQRDELRKTTTAQQLEQRVREALFPLPRGAKGKAAEAFERLSAAVRKALEMPE